MGVRWEYLDAEGEPLGRPEPFADRAGAEDWLGEVWSELLDTGIEQVELHDEDGGRTLYRMGLREA